VLLALLDAALLAAMMLSACGGGSSSGTGPQIPVSLTGNWQFTVAAPADGSFQGGLQGGFLQQDSGSVKGAAAYAVSLSEFLFPCNTGSAAISGTISGQNVTLTAVAGTQTFTFTGTLSFDGSTMVGTYVSTAGTAGDGVPCGTAQTVPMQWTAILVPPITGTIQGTLHSAGGAAGLSNQDFPVSGSLTQVANTGASNAAATVTGTLNFVSSDYPCFNIGSDSASVYGQISGNSVTLQIVGTDESIPGEIGETLGASGATGISPVTFDSVHGGYILHGAEPSYLVATTACPGSLGSTATAGDFGNICLALASDLLGATSACQEPVTLTPASLTFPAQTVGTISTQTVTLANTSGTALSGLTLGFANIPASATDFSETDACGVDGAPSQGAPFGIAAGASCAITIIFSPQCATGCANPLAATLTVTSPVSADNDRVFAMPIIGTGTSAGAVSTRVSEFGAGVEERHAEIH
jgi:hypothetical protein